MENKLEEYSLLNENFEVIDKVKTLDFENKDEKYIVVPMEEFISLHKDRDVLSKLYDAGVDNWVGYDDALNDEEY